MKRAGASITWISEPLIKEPRDYKTSDIFSRTSRSIRITTIIVSISRKVGDKGFAAAFANLSASPMHHIMKEFLDATKFYLEMYDHPKEMRQLCEDMEPYFDQIFRVLADSPAEVIFSGANYDEMITYPPFFRDHIMPHLQKLADLLHPKGKASSLPLRRREQGASGSDRGKRDGHCRSHLPTAHD